MFVRKMAGVAISAAHLRLPGGYVTAPGVSERWEGRDEEVVVGGGGGQGAEAEGCRTVVR